MKVGIWGILGLTTGLYTKKLTPVAEVSFPKVVPKENLAC
jgi:hypothetical protein